MLAGKRVKQKWSQDPQNDRWSRDKSKYGYRMLQSMGWQEGKGLGVNEDGDTHHVKIQKKRDGSGVGGKRSRDDEWIERQDAFDKILADLNAAQSDILTKKEAEKGPNKTLVESAKEAKKIVYKRFLHSKDLSAQSSEDLDCVLGRKKRRKHEEKSEVVLVSSDATSQSHGVTTITKTQSVQEYFSGKLAARKARTNNSNPST